MIGGGNDIHMDDACTHYVNGIHTHFLKRFPISFTLSIHFRYSFMHVLTMSME